MYKVYKLIGKRLDNLAELTIRPPAWLRIQSRYAATYFWNKAEERMENR